MQASALVDVLIVGGGPAGLAAALMLGRARRRVVVVDAGAPRNARVDAVHGLLGHSGVAPGELLRAARAQLEPYAVTFVEDEVTGIVRAEHGFIATTRRGRFEARKVLIATGIRDVLPDVPGVQACWAKSVFVCPYCDGWEVRDRRLALWGPGDQADVAAGLTSWSADVVFFAASALTPAQARALARLQVRVVERPVRRLEHDEGQLRAVVVDDERVARDALFLHFGQVQASPLAESLGCVVSADGTLPTGRGEHTTVPGVFVAGDASEGLQQVSVASAEGVRAACAINAELRKEDIGEV